MLLLKWGIITPKQTAIGRDVLLEIPRNHLVKLTLIKPIKSVSLLEVLIFYVSFLGFF